VTQPAGEVCCRPAAHVLCWRQTAWQRVVEGELVSTTFDVVVIGAGVIGASVALELGRAGRRVCVVDRGPSAGSGSTSASSAIVRYNYSTWTGVAVSWESKHAWQSWAEHLGAVDDAGMCRFVRTGGLVLESPGQDRAKVLALFDRAGIPYEVWDADALREHLPQLQPGRHFPPRRIDDDAFWDEPQGELTAYWMPDAGFVDDPQLAAQNLARAAERCGARFRFRSTVVAVERAGERVAGERVSGVRLADGTRLAAPVVVNVAGPHSARVNALAGVLDDFAVSTRPLRQEVHHVAAPPGLGDAHQPAPLVADLDLGTYFRGTPGGGLMVGGTEPECDPLEWLDDPDDCDPNPSQAVYQAHLYRAARRLPSLTVPDSSRGTAGVYDVSDDWIPLYDRTCLPGYYVAVGTSGNQFKNAPVVGRMMAELVEAVETGHDHDADPVQVRLPYTGFVADLAHYSRRRALNADSSFSVMG
jgi:sarcosine oxidase, subunit beta